jgi:hypothetical protein
VPKRYSKSLITIPPSISPSTREPTSTDLPGQKLRTKEDGHGKQQSSARSRKAMSWKVERLRSRIMLR